MKKSLNELVIQLRRCQKHESRCNHSFFQVGDAFRNTLKSRYGINNPREAKEFVSKYGRDYRL